MSFHKTLATASLKTLSTTKGRFQRRTHRLGHDFSSQLNSMEPLESRVLLSATYAPLYSFTGGTDGISPNSIVIDSSGNIYGSTFVGGAHGRGTIFKIAAGQTTPTTLLAFTGTDGVGTNPSLVVDAAGDVFGTTPTGGDFSNGSIFEIAAGTDTVSPIFSFPSAAFDPNPTLVVDSSGNLFGTTTSGGANSHGQIFEITHPGLVNQTFSTVYSFTSGDGTPGRLAIDSNNQMFATTSTSGANGGGQILLINGSASTAIASLPAHSGTTTLTVDSNNNLIGITSTGGANSAGTIFKVDGGTHAVSTLYTFTGGADGADPNGNIVVDSSGDVFGSTLVGGHGAAFELVAGQSAVTSLHAFSGNDGNQPTYGIIGNAAGTMYGITSNGGAHTDGAIFQLQASAGSVATHVVFTSAPADGAAGSLGTITVAVEDANGTVVTTDNSTVKLTLASGPAGSKLSGTLTAKAVNGVATFTHANITSAGTFTLEATDGVLTPDTTGNFTLTVTASAATQLVFSQQPPKTTSAGAVIAPALTVSVEDKSKHVVTTDNSMVTISIRKGPAGGAFAGGTFTVQAVNGVATFNDLVIDAAGNYSLIATDGLLKAAKAKTMTVTPDSNTTHLVVVTPPATTGVVGAKLTPLTVSLKDQFGNIVKSKTNATVTIATGPNGAVVDGSASASMGKGTATFKSLVLNTGGVYTLQVTDAGVVNGTNAAVTFPITTTPGTTTVVAPKTANTYAVGSTITLKTTLKSNVSSKVPFTGTATIVDSSLNVLGTVSVSTKGAVVATINGLAAGTYNVTLVYTGDSNHTDVTSSVFTIVVV